MAGEGRTNLSTEIFASAKSGAVITTSDTGEELWNALWIGTEGSGNLKVDLADGTTIAFVGVGVGFFPVAVSRVYATGTDVDDIVGLNW